MKQGLANDQMNWKPFLDRLVQTDNLPTYPGDLKTDLLSFAGLSQHPKGQEIYQLAVEMARLTTCCDPEIIYWFSRLASLFQAA